MSYTTKFIHDLRVGQTIYLIDTKRVKCSKCGNTSHWKYCPKATKITGLGWWIDNKKHIDIWYYCQQGKDKCMPISDTIFTTREEAEEECSLRQHKEDKIQD
ncbi:hypothetical protein LCGC14_1374060 [marine sediment metagenome]|uniref:Uncharacterized protein n=1 Tax=marine sediment metagenome TaxID=412755 RepID=A0A0F9K4X4_9ZZZZ